MKTLYLNMLIPYLTHSPADKVVNHSTALSSAAARQRSSTTTHRITRRRSPQAAVHLTFHCFTRWWSTTILC